MDFDRQIDRTAQAPQSEWVTTDYGVFALLSVCTAAWMWLLVVGVVAAWRYLFR